MTAILHAEWLKVRSVRSTMWILLALGLFVCLAAWIAWYGAITPGAVPHDARVNFALGVQARLTGDVAGLCCAVLAVLAISSEYTTGTIRTTFVAMPRRRSVLAAKAAVVAAVAALAGLASVWAVYGLTRTIFNARLVPEPSLPAVAATLRSMMVGRSGNSGSVGQSCEKRPPPPEEPAVVVRLDVEVDALGPPPLLSFAHGKEQAHDRRGDEEQGVLRRTAFTDRTQAALFAVRHGLVDS